MKVDPSIDPDFSADPNGLELRIIAIPGGMFSMQWREKRGAPYTFATKLNFEELLGNIIRVASEHKIGGKTYEDRPEQMIRRGEVPPGYAAVILSKEAAERFSYGLSDLLCWAQGFNAALSPDDTSRRPMGVEEVRDLNIHLKRAIQKVEA